MKIALDLFPILLFFAAYKLGTIYEATAVLMAATLVQSLLMYRLEGKLATMQKVTLALIVVFGGLTLLLQDERFIKYKPTLLYSCMALALFFSQFVLKKRVKPPNTTMRARVTFCMVANLPSRRYINRLCTKVAAINTAVAS